MVHAEFGDVVLTAQNYATLIFFVAVVLSKWWTYDSNLARAPKPFTTVVFIVVWFLLDIAHIVGAFSYYYASTHPQHYSKFNIDNSNEHDATYILMLIHLVFAQATYTLLRVRNLKKKDEDGKLVRTWPYYVSTIFYLLLWAVSIALAALVMHQHAWGSGIGFILYSLGHTVILAILFFRQFRGID